MVFSYIYSSLVNIFSGSVREEEESSNDLSSSCIIGKSLTPNVMAPMPKNTVLTNVKN
jgi:hypothetical protein